MPEQTFQPTPPIYSEQLKTKGKTYFFDVRAAKNGNKYISITETWIKDGQNHRSNVTVFQNNLQEFSNALSQTLEHVKA
jgi:hypothetical protein